MRTFPLLSLTCQSSFELSSSLSLSQRVTGSLETPDLQCRPLPLSYPTCPSMTNHTALTNNELVLLALVLIHLQIQIVNIVLMIISVNHIALQNASWIILFYSIGQSHCVNPYASSKEYNRLLFINHLLRYWIYRHLFRILQASRGIRVYFLIQYSNCCNCPRLP